MSNAFKDRADVTLAGLSWRAEDSRATLQMMKGEIKVKKRLTFGMAIAMALILATMAIAVAEIIRFSVKDYQNLTEETVEKHLTAIGQELKHEDVTIYITDSIFDGSVQSVAFEAVAVSGKPVYLLAKLTESANGKVSAPRVISSQGMGIDQGFWVPERGAGGTGGKYGFDMQMDVKDAKDDIVWELTFEVLHPVWEIVEDGSGYSDDAHSTAEEQEAWERQFEAAYHNRQIMLAQGHSLGMFESLLPEGEDMAQRLVASGAFQRAGSLKASWSSPAAEITVLQADQIIKGEGFEVRIQKISASFMRMSYDFTLKVTDKEMAAALWDTQGRLMDFEATAEGAALRYLSSSGGVLDENPQAPVIRYSGELAFTGERPDSLVFRPYFPDEQGGKAYSDKGEFSVEIK